MGTKKQTKEQNENNNKKRKSQFIIIQNKGKKIKQKRVQKRWLEEYAFLGRKSVI